MALLIIGGAMLVAWAIHQRSSMGQIGPLYPEDPTGGAYWESVGPLGPGENIAVAYQWLGQSKPRGFSVAAIG